MISVRQLKERKLAQWALAYVAGAWAVLQGLDLVAGAFGWPRAVNQIAIVVLAIGLLGALVVAWYHGENGAQRVSRMEIGLLAGVLALVGVGVAFVAPSPAKQKAEQQQERAAAPAVVEQGSIAVLPFENLSSDKQQEYFAAGVSEDVLDLLSTVPALRVAARTSAFAFKDRAVSVDSVARVLRVANVLEGSVQKAGEDVRVSVRLVRASDGSQVWAQSWTRPLTDVFAIQDEIARDVTRQLKVKLLGAAPQAQATDPEAYALYLRARELARQGAPAAVRRADSLYREVLAIDPRYAPAWVNLGTNLSNEAGGGLMPSAEGFQQAREAVEHALSIDSIYAPAYALLGTLAMKQQRDMAGAARDYARALALEPTNLVVLGNSANLLMSLGRVREAIAVYEYVAARDPVNAAALYNLGGDYAAAGRLEEATAQYRTALSLSPGRGAAHYALAIVLLRKGEATAALREMEQEPVEPYRMIGLPMIYHALGRKAESDAALTELIRKYPKDAPYNIAYVYAYRGEADSAFAWLEKAVEYGDSGLSGIATEPLFDHIHSDPRWLPFLRKIGKAPEQLEKIPFRVRLPATPAAPQGASPPAAASPRAT